MWQFGHEEGRKSEYVHGSHRLEMFWTAVPAVLLIFIAVVQIRTWEKIKYQARMPEPQEVLQVTGRQWEWRIRHRVPPGLDDLALGDDLELLTGDKLEAMKKKIDGIDLVPASPRGWAEHPEIDDLHLVNELHTWKNANVKVYLQTADVIHSFFLPNLRLKQDALPGKTIPLWFAVSEANAEYDADTGKWRTKDRPGLTYELACAELCGARHYAMRGRMVVHETKADYLLWLRKANTLQKSTKPDERTGPLTSLVDR
jgi:cytochrome c oxidase subunit 2